MRHYLQFAFLSVISSLLFTMFCLVSMSHGLGPGTYGYNVFLHILYWFAKSITTIVMSSTKLLLYLLGPTRSRKSLVMPCLWAAIARLLFSNCTASVLALSSCFSSSRSLWAIAAEAFRLSSSQRPSEASTRNLSSSVKSTTWTSGTWVI